MEKSVRAGERELAAAREQADAAAGATRVETPDTSSDAAPQHSQRVFADPALDAVELAEVVEARDLIDEFAFGVDCQSASDALRMMAADAKHIVHSSTSRRLLY